MFDFWVAEIKLSKYNNSKSNEKLGKFNIALKIYNLRLKISAITSAYKNVKLC